MAHSSGRFKMSMDRFNYFEIDAETNEETGKRLYNTPVGPAPSVTTILSTIPNPKLQEWKDRVGPEEAKRVSKEATDIGSYMHDMLEAHLKDEEFVRDGTELETMAVEMFHALRMFGFRHLNEVWGIEVPLHYEDLYAGRTDLVGVFKRKASIIDYKSSTAIKSADRLEDYKTQIAAYSIAHEQMFPGLEFEQGVILLATRPNPKFKMKSKPQLVIIDKDELDHYRRRWVGVLETFYG